MYGFVDWFDSVVISGEEWIGQTAAGDLPPAL
jgi:hypothetical protein